MKDKDKERMLGMIEEALKALEKELPDNVKVLRLSDVMNGDNDNTPTAIAKKSLDEVERTYTERYVLGGGNIRNNQLFTNEKDILKYSQASRIAIKLMHKWTYDNHEHKLSHKLRMIKKSYREDRVKGYEMFENAIIGFVLTKFKADIIESYELTPVSNGDKK